MNIFQSRIAIHILVVLSGMAALSWEVIWQVKSTLALGVSAWGTALTLAVTMGGMSAGALLMGRALKNKVPERPARIYSTLEFIVGIAGFFLAPAFHLVENFDTYMYGIAPAFSSFVHIIGIILVLGVPTLCLGATLPVLGVMARQYQTSLALLYGLNTFGAAAGALLAAFVFIPLLGLTHAAWVLALINIGVAVIARKLAPGEETQKDTKITISQTDIKTAAFIVAITGFATFVLEIAWFRSLTAAFMSTTDAFAIMLSSVLVSLSVGAMLAPVLKKYNKPLGWIIGFSGVLIILMTPVIERFDLLVSKFAEAPVYIFIQWFFMTLGTVALPVALLGVALPWLLDEQSAPRRWGMLYGLNAVAAIIGSIAAAWILLPAVGFARTAWMAGAIVVLAGIMLTPRQKKIVLAALLVVALGTAITFESGVGRTRVQGATPYSASNKADKVLAAYEGPDVTTSVVQYQSGRRLLFIDGFSATEEGTQNDKILTEHYMAWMGHLPMLLHADPKNALVICFGTGQTANAVRKEKPESLDIVDINKNVFKLAGFFSKNENVLADPIVKSTIMDGRAFIRRTNKVYDVITLEPMPPNFAGANALYSKEFYSLARAHMSDNGVIAQWLPFHLVPAHYSESVVKTFREVFPNAILWIDPPSKTGILLGSKNDAADLERNWPGLGRFIKRDMSTAEIRRAVKLGRDEMERYAASGEVITDDNQLLSYGRAAHLLRSLEKHEKENQKKLNDAINSKR